MPELTHDAEDGFHEIQLSGKQLVFLFMATTVVSVVIFLCGVLVGRGVRAERGGEDPTVAAAAPAPGPAAEAAPTATEPPTPPAEEDLSYDKRLRSGSAPQEQLKKSAEVAAAKPPEPQPAAPQPSEPPPPAPEPPAPPAAPPVAGAADVPGSARPGNWVIQVHALQNRETASTFVRSLTSKGYPAFLLTPSPGSPQIFRVQIGAYRDKGEAEQVAIRLEKEEQFKTAIKRR